MILSMILCNNVSTKYNQKVEQFVQYSQDVLDEVLLRFSEEFQLKFICNSYKFSQRS